MAQVTMRIRMHGRFAVSWVLCGALTLYYFRHICSRPARKQRIIWISAPITGRSRRDCAYSVSSGVGWHSGRRCGDGSHAGMARTSGEILMWKFRGYLRTNCNTWKKHWQKLLEVRIAHDRRRKKKIHSRQHTSNSCWIKDADAEMELAAVTQHEILGSMYDRRKESKNRIG